MERVCFTCPKCGIRRKTYFYNLKLRIRCKKCQNIFIVGYGLNIVFKKANEPVFSTKLIDCVDRVAKVIHGAGEHETDIENNDTERIDVADDFKTQELPVYNEAVRYDMSMSVIYSLTAMFVIFAIARGLGIL